MPKEDDGQEDELNELLEASGVVESNQGQRSEEKNDETVPKLDQSEQQQQAIQENAQDAQDSLGITNEANMSPSKEPESGTKHDH